VTEKGFGLFAVGWFSLARARGIGWPDCHEFRGGTE
jgi:hypothetical protein